MSTLRRVLQVIEPHPGEHFKDKIIAVSLAFLVWFAVNSQNSIPAFYPAVPVRLANLPPNLALAAEVQDTLNVQVSGPEGDMQRVTAGLLSPEIDLSGARVGENFFQITADDLNVPGAVLVTSIEPPQIRVLLEERQDKYVEVAPVTSGEPGAGFEIVGRSTDPEVVLVTGPRSIIEGLERIETTTVDVSNSTESFTRTVPLYQRNRLVELPRQRTVEMRVDIAELAVNEQFDAVQVVVINNRYQVAVNPAELGVVLSGPPSVLAQLDAAQMELVIDAAALEPQDDDYRIEPVVRFADPQVGGRVQVVALYPQRVIDVHIFPQPTRQ